MWYKSNDWCRCRFRWSLVQQRSNWCSMLQAIWTAVWSAPQDLKQGVWDAGVFLGWPDASPGRTPSLSFRRSCRGPPEVSGLCFLKLWLFGELVDIRGIKCASPSNCHALIAGAWNLWELTAVGMAPHRMHNSINLGTRQRVPCLSFRQESLSQFAFQPKTRSNYWMACQMTGANSPCQPTLLTSAVGLGHCTNWLHLLALLYHQGHPWPTASWMSGGNEWLEWHRWPHWTFTKMIWELLYRDKVL